MSRRKSAKAPEQGPGSYVQLPCAVLKSAAFIGCSAQGKAVLLELLAQHNGRNNGHLHLSAPYLAKRGFYSRGQIAKGREELIGRGLIIKTNQGGLPTRKPGGTVEFEGADLFAITWLPISNYVGLSEIRAGEYLPGAWADDVPLRIKKPREALVEANRARQRAALERKLMQTAARSTGEPCHGTPNTSSEPCHGSIVTTIDRSSGPCHGKNVFASTCAERSKGAEHAGGLDSDPANVARLDAYLAKLRAAGFGAGKHAERCSVRLRLVEGAA